MIMKEIRFVDVGEGITEGHIKKWLVKDGDAVKEDQPLFQVETDKAVVNMPSPIDGIVRIFAKEDSTVKVGDTIAQVGTKEELSGAQPVQASQPPKQQAPVPEEHKTVPILHEGVMATPFVRKLAHDLKVDITTVTGTGPGGRILENDVRSHAQAESPQKKAVPKFSETLEQQHQNDIERVPMSQTRKAIARNMEASLSIPSAVHMDLVDATALYNIVSGEKARVQADTGTKLTFLPFIMKATVEALKENPNFNSSYDHETMEIILKKYYNIGLAAEAPDGLKVVVIKYVDKKSIITLAKELQNLADKVRNQTITLDEMRDNTFTITNIGSLGGGYLAVPIINHPDVAILGIGMIRDTPLVKDGVIKIGKQMPISLVFDHRVVDGAEAVKFGNAFKKYIEDPEFLEML
ncbi:MAG: 2-oxo acid dehydrogenase subunit E2 [Candidatus Micrarchaeota archaeon]|nr:2-oxo acid dehydrogenase subunit E2 [Candidatus Micrarchaeota archaeon]